MKKLIECYTPSHCSLEAVECMRNQKLVTGVMCVVMKKRIEGYTLSHWGFEVLECTAYDCETESSPQVAGVTCRVCVVYDL
jgi:hypothetical protein